MKAYHARIIFAWHQSIHNLCRVLHPRLFRQPRPVVRQTHPLSSSQQVCCDKPPNIDEEQNNTPKEKNAMVLFADQAIRVEISVEFQLHKKGHNNNSKQINIGGQHKAFFAKLLAVCGRNVMLHPTSKNRDKNEVTPAISKETEFPSTDRAHNKFFERSFRNKNGKPSSVHVLHSIQSHKTAEEIKNSMQEFLRTNNIWLHSPELDKTKWVGVAWIHGADPKLTYSTAPLLLRKSMRPSSP